MRLGKIGVLFAVSPVSDVNGYYDYIMALFLIARVSQALVSGNRALNIFSSNPNGHERAESRVEQACKTGV